MWVNLGRNVGFVLVSVWPEVLDEAGGEHSIKHVPNKSDDSTTPEPSTTPAHN